FTPASCTRPSTTTIPTRPASSAASRPRPRRARSARPWSTRSASGATMRSWCSRSGRNPPRGRASAEIPSPLRLLGRRHAMATESVIATRIRVALAEHLKRDVSKVQPQDDLKKDLGLDSLAMIELLFKIEEAFDLEIPNDDLSQIATVG